MVSKEDFDKSLGHLPTKYKEALEKIERLTRILETSRRQRVRNFELAFKWRKRALEAEGVCRLPDWFVNVITDCIVDSKSKYEITTSFSDDDSPREVALLWGGNTEGVRAKLTRPTYDGDWILSEVDHET